jgi:hypothetical protein
MDDKTTSGAKKNHHGCACCTKAKYVIPEEFMSPELKIFKENMSEEEFEELIKGLM